jgi:hypothetical protein
METTLFALTTTDRVSIAVALTTLAVAIATGWLAWNTRNLASETTRMAKATENEAEEVAKQARTSSAALRAATRPWLSIGIEGGEPAQILEDSEQHIVVNLKVRNLGPGLALIPPEGCTISGPGRESRETVTRRGFATTPVLPPNEETWLTLRVEGSDIDAKHFLRKMDSFGQATITVLYFDSDMGSGRQAEFRIAALSASGTPWRLYEIEYFAPIADDADGNIIDRESLALVKFNPIG